MDKLQRSELPHVAPSGRIQKKPRGKRGQFDMPLVNVVFFLIIIGVVLWLINRFIPMAGSIKSILNAVVVIAVIVWLLNVFGFMSTNIPRIHLG
jgi:hypothetical protein